jgi:hypothetical protein
MRGKKRIQKVRGICHALFEAHCGHDFMLWEDNSEFISIGKSAVC